MMRDLGLSKHVYPDSFRPQHEQAYFWPIGGGNGIVIEVHSHLQDPDRYPLDHGRMWGRSHRSEFDGVPCRRLSPEDYLAHAVLHGALHRLVNLERDLLDARLLLTRGGVDYARFVERAMEWRITRAAWLMLSLLGDDHQIEGAAEMARSIAPSPPIRRLLRALVPDSNGTRLDRLDYRSRAAFLWPVLLDSPLDTARMLATHPSIKWIRDRLR